MFDKSKILKTLTNKEKQQLEVFCQEKSLREGEILFKEGDEANAMYILQEGEIRIYKNNLGDNILLGNIEAEEILGEMALFGKKGKRMATAKAIQDSILLVILSFSIKEITSKHPELLEKIKEIIEVRDIQNKNKQI